MSGENKEDVFENYNIFDGIEEVEGIFNKQSSEEEVVEDNEEEASADSEETTEEDVVEEQDLGGTNSNDTDDTETSSLLTPYAKFLYEEGVLPNLNLEQFDGTSDGLKAAMGNEIVAGIDQYKKSLPAEVKMLIDNYEAGVPFEEIIGLQSNRVRYESIPEADIKSNEELQKALVGDYLSATTAMSQDKIDKYIKRLSDLGELEEEAVTSRTELVKIQEVELQERSKKAEQDRVAREQNRIKELEELKSTVSSTKEIIPGQPVSQIMKDKILKNMTTAVATDDYGNPVSKLGLYRSKNPVQTEMILNYLFEATKEFTDWSLFGKAVKSTVLKELEAASKNIDNNQSGAPAKGKPSGSKSELMNAIKNIDF